MLLKHSKLLAVLFHIRDLPWSVFYITTDTAPMAKDVRKE